VCTVMGFTVVGLIVEVVEDFVVIFPCLAVYLNVLGVVLFPCLYVNRMGILMLPCCSSLF
jgi:hypothetical protein